MYAVSVPTCHTEKQKEKDKIPRPWNQNSHGDNSRPSNDVNRRPRSFCSHRWIPDADAGASEVHAVPADTGDRKECSAAVAVAAEGNVEAEA